MYEYACTKKSLSPKNVYMPKKIKTVIRFPFFKIIYVTDYCISLTQSNNIPYFNLGISI